MANRSDLDAVRQRTTVDSAIIGLAEDDLIPQFLASDSCKMNSTSDAETISKTNALASLKAVLGQVVDECFGFAEARLTSLSCFDICHNLFARTARQYREHCELYQLGLLYTVLHGLTSVDCVSNDLDRKASPALPKATGERHSLALLVVATAFHLASLNARCKGSILASRSSCRNLRNQLMLPTDLNPEFCT